jgi:hypothetical protein
MWHHPCELLSPQVTVAAAFGIAVDCLGVMGYEIENQNLNFHLRQVFHFAFL